MLSEQEAKEYVNKKYAEWPTEGKSVQEKLAVVNTIINELVEKRFAVVLDKVSLPVRVQQVSYHNGQLIYHV